MLVVLVASLALAASASAAVVAGNTGWFWSNPLPQGNSLTRVETIAGRAYVSGEAGAIMRSDNGGASWTGIRSGLPARKSQINVIRAVTPDTVIFASSCGLRRTDDGGVSVKRLPWGSDDVNCPAPIASLSFPTTSIGYLLLTNGDIMQTQDGGDSWRRQTPAPGSQTLGGAAAVADIAFTSATAGVISVGNQIFYSSDSGSSWTPVKTVDGSLVHFEFTSAAQGYAVGSNSSMYATTDGGATWAAVPSDGATNAAVIGSLGCSSTTTCLAATADGSRILRTTDSGATWASLTASSRPIFGVGFTSATHAIAVGAGGATVSTDDAGINWASLTSEALGVLNAVHVDNATSAVLFGDGTSLARTTDAGASFKTITTLASGKVKDATFATAQRGYVLDSRNQLTRSDDGGITWKVLDLGGAKPEALLAPNEKTLLLVGGKGVRRSADAGLSFKSVGASKFRKLKFRSVDRGKGATVVYGDSAAALSKDDGKNFKAIKLNKKIEEVKLLDFADAKNGWLVDYASELWVTTNGGAKWTRNETNGLGQIKSMARTDSKHGYLADRSGSIFVTADSGKTWAEQAPFLSAKAVPTLVSSLSASGAILLVPGTNRILMTSTLGQIGTASVLKIKPSSPKAKKGKELRVAGTLKPSQGGEIVTVACRDLAAKSGTSWKYKSATVSLGGTFTTTWRFNKATTCVARWAGDATHDGDGATAIDIKLKK